MILEDIEKRQRRHSFCRDGRMDRLDTMNGNPDKEIAFDNKIGGPAYYELIAFINQEGFELDWHKTEEPMDGRQITLQDKLFEESKADSYRALFYLGVADPSIPMSESVRFLHSLAAAFIKALSVRPEIEFLREKTVVEPEADIIGQILHNAPYMNGSEYLSRQWAENIWKGLNSAFSREIKLYAGSAADFLSSLSPEVHPVGRIFFHLVESKKDDYPFAFMATYSVGMGSDGRARHLPLKNALAEYKNDPNKLLELLSTVNKASQESEFIAELIETGEIFQPISLTSTEAYTFLKEVPLYEEAGILCRIPKWWRNKSNSLKLSLNIGGKEPSRLGFDALLDFDVRLSIGNESITVNELKKLLSETEGLAFIKGRWVEVDPKKLREALAAFERARKLMGGKGMSLSEAMSFQLNASEILGVPEEACETEVTNGEWLNNVVSKLTCPDKIGNISAGRNFHAALRGYQQKGLSWLYFMKSLGLGACLADDMGLGKTVQVIALLNTLNSSNSSEPTADADCGTAPGNGAAARHGRIPGGGKRGKALLVIPASLIGNWANEIVKFAPSLRFRILHPSVDAAANCGGTALLGESDIFITTYGMLLKYDWLKEITWDVVILDEAQAIKNPGTRQTKAVKQLKAAFRIAMTGTPVENRVSDLWSLFDFLDRGLLGSPKEFTAFAKKLPENPKGYSRLKKVVSPFILRRLKTDKSIISDLPEKIEMKTYSALTKKQAVLYNKLVNELKEKLESTDEGIERKGLILSSIIKFKQICNHPDQYLGQTLYDENESGKFERLREICETIYEKRERVLVFTQFKEITGPLERFLETVFHHKGLVLHGSTAVSKRREIVEKFQGKEYVPFLVLSIKAGGVGLNLTSANHIIHFDRWWNPAVENQATDRAFRIGQKKNVIVHKFITKGTIEEKIDLIIEDKIKLSKDILPDVRENWITEMDNKQLMNLFRLGI